MLRFWSLGLDTGSDYVTQQWADRSGGVSEDDEEALDVEIAKVPTDQQDDFKQQMTDALGAGLNAQIR